MSLGLKGGINVARPGRLVNVAQKLRVKFELSHARMRGQPDETDTAVTFSCIATIVWKSKIKKMFLRLELMRVSLNCYSRVIMNACEFRILVLSLYRY